jgi:hypothetical protein
MTEWILYQHTDGRSRVSQSNAFTAGDPGWHRCYPVEVEMSSSPVLYALIGPDGEVCDDGEEGEGPYQIVSLYPVDSSNLQALFAHAKGQISHIYQGSCPDRGSPDARDPECPVCRALDASPPAEQKPVAISRDGNLFWSGSPTEWRGFNGNLYLAPQPVLDIESIERQIASIIDAKGHAEALVNATALLGYVRGATGAPQ